MSANIFLPPTPVAPQFLIITNITNSYPMVVTVSTSNQYVAGQLVYFSVPVDYGMTQANGLTGQILSITGSNLILSINIDSTLFDPFVTPSTFQEQPASLAPAGARNIYNTITVPFHSASNTGN